MRFWRNCTGKPTFLVILLAALIILSGCKKGDINIVRMNPLGDRLDTVGRVFEHYSQFRTIHWDTIDNGRGSHLVVFTGELSREQVIRAATGGAAAWLPAEKRYFEAVFPELRKVFIRVTFPILGKGSFNIGNVSLGMAAQNWTEWSDPFTADEKMAVINALYENNPEIHEVIKRYVDPSFPAASNLYFRITGIAVSGF